MSLPEVPSAQIPGVYRRSRFWVNSQSTAKNLRERGIPADRIDVNYAGLPAELFESPGVVVKTPRWAFEKFSEANATLGIQMKSVAETMSIGRTFKEALQKSVRSLEQDRFGLG